MLWCCGIVRTNTAIWLKSNSEFKLLSRAHYCSIAVPNRDYLVDERKIAQNQYHAAYFNAVG